MSAPLGSLTPISLTAVAVLNHLLRGQPWLRERLLPFAGRSVRLETPPLALVLTIDAEGHLQAAAGEVDATARLSPLTVARLMVGEEAARSSVEVTGDAALAAAVSGVLRELRWDAAEDLSRLIGDIPAERLVRLGGALLAWQRQTLVSLTTAMGEYLVEERRVFPSRSAVATWAREVDALRDSAARLAERIDRLHSHVDLPHQPQRVDRPRRQVDRPQRRTGRED